ncbi:MAG: hypothetical protein HAW67_00195 [Endozoicomonadaceae bacterium]|nr:hypothetical protein [Endozoicomonadaceae bacterium]
MADDNQNQMVDPVVPEKIISDETLARIRQICGFTEDDEIQDDVLSLYYKASCEILEKINFSDEGSTKELVLASMTAHLSLTSGIGIPNKEEAGRYLQEYMMKGDGSGWRATVPGQMADSLTGGALRGLDWKPLIGTPATTNLSNERSGGSFERIVRGTIPFDRLV